MLFSKIKDLKNRLNYSKFEKLKQIKKFVLINLLLKLHLKFKSRQHLFIIISKLNSKYISKVKFVHRCVLTNRNRRVIRPYNISHCVFRNLTQFGLIPGCKKAVW